MDQGSMSPVAVGHETHALQSQSDGFVDVSASEREICHVGVETRARGIEPECVLKGAFCLIQSAETDQCNAQKLVCWLGIGPKLDKPACGLVGLAKLSVCRHQRGKVPQRIE